MDVVTYARVSSIDGTQTVENQVRDLDRWLAAMEGREGFRLVESVTEMQSTRDTRPEKERVLKLLRTKQADTVVFWSLDRWGRTMRELVLEFDEAVHRGWTFISLREGISLDTAAGKLFAHILAAMAEFERTRLSERTKAGMERARAQGKHIGRPRKTVPAKGPAV